MIKVENGTVECDGKPIDIILEISLVLCDVISSLAESAQKSENEVAEDILETVNSAVRYAIKGANISQKETRP